jgi:hypothetical protein
MCAQYALQSSVKQMGSRVVAFRQAPLGGIYARFYGTGAIGW